jgi:hypothetical protein
VDFSIGSADFIVEGHLEVVAGRTVACVRPQQPDDVTTFCDGAGGGAHVHSGGKGGACFDAGGFGGEGQVGASFSCPGAHGGGGFLSDNNPRVGGGSGGSW